MKQNKTITVFRQEQGDGEWPPEDAKGCMAWFAAKLALIPEEYRDNARIEFDSIASYEDASYATIEITYVRPETDEEERIREHRRQATLAMERQRELDLLTKLKAKYPAA